MIIVNDNEDLEKAIKRFRRQIQKSHKMDDYKKHQYYVSKSEKRKKKHEAYIRRTQKETA